jgi:hypothetical protein
MSSHWVHITGDSTALLEFMALYTMLTRQPATQQLQLLCAVPVSVSNATTLQPSDAKGGYSTFAPWAPCIDLVGWQGKQEGVSHGMKSQENSPQDGPQLLSDSNKWLWLMWVPNSKLAVSYSGDIGLPVLESIHSQVNTLMTQSTPPPSSSWRPNQETQHVGAPKQIKRILSFRQVFST